MDVLASSASPRLGPSNVKPLDGVKILDLTRVLAGPFATMNLGDLGAEVIKVERPGAGDDTRAWGPPFAGTESVYFLSVNRNKKSIAINMKDSKGIKLIKELAAASDVFVENFVPGKLAEMGLGYEDIKKIAPHIVYCSITVDGGKALDVLYLDFSKTFDTVPLSILLEKLAAHGLDRTILCWVKNWLDGWAHSVVVNDTESNLWLIISGVPQGSILVPVLFDKAVDDVDTEIECTPSYGQTGPLVQRGGYDSIAAAVSGLMHITGHEDGEPVRSGVAMTDLATGLYTYGAIMAGLLQRYKTGRGLHIDCNLLSTQVACLTHVAANYLNCKIEGKRWGTAHGSIVPYQVKFTFDFAFDCISVISLNFSIAS
ncbi:succinyl-CoA:glutarate-CoA transferase [Turdus rufiventris]|nr:succinyl-CoA:glutarate-CoA transferase [Turdus rufiventris]